MTKPFVMNIARRDVQKYAHHENNVLVSINDYGDEPPSYAYSYPNMVAFDFNDVEENNSDEFLSWTAIRDWQAAAIAAILQQCLKERMNIIVHCSAGISRSGAVAEVAEMLGFEYIGTYKQPNLFVKDKLMKFCGLTNSWDE